MITVELHGLRLHAHHGVHAHEKEQGQEFLFDVELDVGDRGSSDRVEDAVDYSAVARVVKDVSDAHAYDLLEALASAVADELLARFEPTRLRVSVAKPSARPGDLDATPRVSVSRP